MACLVNSCQPLNCPIHILKVEPNNNSQKSTLRYSVSQNSTTHGIIFCPNFVESSFYHVHHPQHSVCAFSGVI